HTSHQAMHAHAFASVHFRCLDVRLTDIKLFDSCCKFASFSSEEAGDRLRHREVGAEHDLGSCVPDDILMEVTQTLARDDDGYSEFAALLHQFRQRDVVRESVRLVQGHHEAEPITLTPLEHVLVDLAEDERSCCVLSGLQPDTRNVQDEASSEQLI